MNPRELHARIKGVIHLVMTPFDKNDVLDEAALRSNLRASIENARGEDFVILAGGSTSEFYAMSDRETKRYMEVVVEEVNGAFPVIMGTARAGTKYTVEMSKLAEEIGADGVMVVNPYYATATEDNLYEHFRQLDAAINIGIMLYNNPITTKLWMPPDLLKRLSELDKVIANKENTSNPMQFFRVQKAMDHQDSVVFTGLGYEMFQYLALSPQGCPAYVSELVNLVPRTAFGIYKAGIARDAEAMKKLIESLEPYRLFCDRAAARRKIPQVVGPLVAGPLVTVYQAAIKEAMTILGIPTGKVRGPVDNLTAEEITELEGVVSAIRAAQPAE